MAERHVVVVEHRQADEMADSHGLRIAPLVFGLERIVILGLVGRRRLLRDNKRARRRVQRHCQQGQAQKRYDQEPAQGNILVGGDHATDFHVWPPRTFILYIVTRPPREFDRGAHCSHCTRLITSLHAPSSSIEAIPGPCLSTPENSILCRCESCTGPTRLPFSS
jgi:hypothetical protein